MAIWWFFGPALALCVLVAALVVLGLRRGAQVQGADSGQKREMRIYADQLKEIERDSARGVIPDDEAARLRAETARRLLDADRRGSRALRESPSAAKWVALVLVLTVPLGAFALYFNQGTPLYGDMPMSARYAAANDLREARLSQDAMEAAWQADPTRPPAPEVEQQYLDLMAQLRAALEQRPDDPRGLRLLAVNEGNIGNNAAAATAWARLIALEGEEAPVEDLVALGESMVLATGGLVSAQAEVVLDRILQRDPRNGTARYYLGLMFAQTGRPDLTFRLWRGLLEDSQPTDPWVPAIRGTIEELSQIAGVRYTLPPVATGGRGPTAEDMQAAAEMSDEDRQQMIGGMVDGPASRLANQGGTAEEWARLIGALGVLGQQERARAIWAEARLVFADQPEGLAQIDAAARSAGFGE
ncbi:c-type cytochrome biogenesis protein CcmI [Pararhodobacter zhoushanensis]|uniref:C-type cytochrome biogenesis protein CcmI n=1 Tax=Pararhodobacter zhoushanensis TaxID=2479545 RepID=A0ABT3GWA6_9RHOB|nr:c-type cytochrome biogenesis protein CcmI [Pararhodobacter zhoushanensis]MCW1931795.1 c-type cytochrome biogenesis protein CcmI [Pararhodobacter zhoushanensis]